MKIMALYLETVLQLGFLPVQPAQPVDRGRSRLGGARVRMAHEAGKIWSLQLRKAEQGERDLDILRP
jgi:hypothetical protein